MAIKRGHIVWAALLLVGGAVEAHGIRHPGQGDTLSEVTRSAFSVHTRPGAAAFLLGWGGFAAWYTRHIVGGPR